MPSKTLAEHTVTISIHHECLCEAAVMMQVGCDGSPVTRSMKREVPPSWRNGRRRFRLHGLMWGRFPDLQKHESTIHMRNCQPEDRCTFDLEGLAMQQSKSLSSPYVSERLCHGNKDNHESVSREDRYWSHNHRPRSADFDGSLSDCISASTCQQVNA